MPEPNEAQAHSRAVAVGMTRDCTDPWEYIEFRVDGEVGPCCVRRIGNLGSHALSEIMNSPAARQLRADLLRGTPDETCRSCGLKGEVAPAVLAERVRRLRHAVHMPDSFDATLYLLANPDVAMAGAEASAHFLEHGRFEGRALRPDY